MKYEQIKHELKNSPTLKLLRSHNDNNTALILSFFYEQFKVTQRISITQSDLETKLDNYLEFLQDIYPDIARQSPKQYLNEWCNDQLLRKRFNSSDDPEFTLTPAAEKAIAWLEDLKRREEFVGTESRFLQIFSLLKRPLAKVTQEDLILGRKSS
ncbi:MULTISPECIES: DUF3375 family protein [unclassified Nostoc]|uniref:DUF3375 family protein n=1 Tax=unclassified Nostoc TaxID=2593658 RepID=UPI002636AD1F|nr:DUF3375 family protein [Nostoc sp. S13]MDF5735670.1 DUF3375 family protein [Nostoc sp. S13]